MEQDQEQVQRLLSEEEFNEEGRVETRRSLNQLFANGEFEHAELYQGRLKRFSRRSSVIEIIMRGVLLISVLVVAVPVFDGERLPQKSYDGLRQILGVTIPHMIAKASLFFSGTAPLIILILADVLLVAGYLFNESLISRLQTSAALRSIYHGILLPVMIVVTFIITFGCWLLINDDASNINKEYNVQATEAELLSNKEALIEQGISLLCRSPVIGDVISASTLVSVVPAYSKCSNTVCALGAIFVFSTIVADFLDVLQMLVTRVCLRNLVYLIVLSLYWLIQHTIGEFFIQFTFGFLLIVVLSAIRFYEAISDYFSVGSAIDRADAIESCRYPDHDEMEKLIPDLDKIAEGLGNVRNVVIYVGNEVGASPESNLSFLSMLWSILPGFAMSLYKKRVLMPIISARRNRCQKNVSVLANNLYNRNGARVTVVTECIDGKLDLPRSATLVELKGDVSHLVCPEGHDNVMDLNEQLEEANLVCKTCQQTLKPVVLSVDRSPVDEAADVINGLQPVSGAVLVLGACENAVIREVILNKHERGEISLFQIGSSGSLPGANVSVSAKPGDVLFEVAEELE